MRRTIVYFIAAAVCFVLQTTVFQALALGGIAPNLMIVFVASFGIMRGRKEGMFLGFFCGLLIDVYFGFFVGGYALLYMYIGYFNGMFKKRFYPDDIKLPMLLIGASDLMSNLAVFIAGFVFRRRFSFFYYLKTIILPEFVYTMVVTILLYFIFLKINTKLESVEKRRAKKFDI